MNKPSEDVSQIRVRGFASRSLSGWAEATGMSGACIAEEVLSVAFTRIGIGDELQSVRAWLDKSAESWAASKAGEAKHVVLKGELTKLHAAMQWGQK